MSLRPRYSLLTLLVLTALVAGGVKLWRGPHHDVFDEPRTGWEEFHLYPVTDCIKAFAGEGVQFQFHLERLRGWEEDAILSLKLVPRQELTLCRYEKNGVVKTVLLTPSMRRTWDAKAKDGVQLVSSERVVCLLHSGRQITVLRIEEVPTPGNPIMFQDDPWQPVAPPTTKMLNGIIEPNPLYLLTERGNIYELEMYANCWEVRQPAKVEEMTDAGLRATTVIELERLALPR